MLDIHFIRENAEVVKNNLIKRAETEKIVWVDSVLKFDKEWRNYLTKANRLRKRRNDLTEEIRKLVREHKNKDEIDANLLKHEKELKMSNDEIKRLEAKASECKEKVNYFLLRLPNIMHETVPIGKDDKDNVEVRRWGEIPQFEFKPKDHIELSLNLDLIDLERATKVSGARFYYLKNALVQLNYGLIKYALDFIEKKDFILVQPPYTIKREAIGGAVSLSDFEDMIYKIEGEDLYLIATSEHAILAMYMNEILDGKKLPLRYAGISPCFRKEAGAHGRDTKGIFRVHQFEKIEQFVFCKPDDSWSEHETLIANAEEFFKKLKIPYRVVNVCSGDLGTVAAKKYDLEIWLPGQNKFREAVSCSNCTSYQATRSKIRYRDSPNDSPTFVYTLNSTLVATERALIAILENYQQKDGTVEIPKALMSYTKGLERIEPKK